MKIRSLVMLDIIFIAIGGGTFVVLALYARALQRL